MKIKVNCDVCKNEFMAKVADRKRGWARCCSKSCAATKSNKKTGKFKKFIKSKNYEEMHPYSGEALGQW